MAITYFFLTIAVSLFLLFGVIAAFRMTGRARRSGKARQADRDRASRLRAQQPLPPRVADVASENIARSAAARRRLIDLVEKQSDGHPMQDPAPESEPDHRVFSLRSQRRDRQ